MLRNIEKKIWRKDRESSYERLVNTDPVLACHGFKSGLCRLSVAVRCISSPAVVLFVKSSMVCRMTPSITSLQIWRNHDISSTEQIIFNVLLSAYDYFINKILITGEICRNRFFFCVFHDASFWFCPCTTRFRSGYVYVCHGILTVAGWKFVSRYMKDFMNTQEYYCCDFRVVQKTGVKLDSKPFENDLLFLLSRRLFF